MKLSTLAVGCNNAVVVTLCGLWGMALLLPLPAHAQVSGDMFSDRQNVTLDTTPKPSSPEPDPDLLATNPDTASNQRAWLAVGIGTVLLLTGVGISVWVYKRRHAPLTTEANIQASTPTPTEEQRRAATARVARISGSIQDLYRSGDYLKRLEMLPGTVTGYASAMTALNVVYILCRDTEKREPTLCRLLTDGWRTLDAYREEVTEGKWRKPQTDEFRNHLIRLTLETEALIQKSRRATSNSPSAK